MLSPRVLPALVVALLVAGCGDSAGPLAPEAEQRPELVRSLDGKGQAMVNPPFLSRVFIAPMSADQEVTITPVESHARGISTFRLSPDGQALHYQILVNRIENVTMAHIHIAPAGANGPVAVWLYPDGPPAMLIQGRTDGVLARGTITDARVIGPLAGQGLDGLLEALRDGRAYVNVHTSQYPAGEIRGQIKSF
jgi:hypothetical protein